jgi:hypothetical protein
MWPHSWSIPLNRWWSYHSCGTRCGHTAGQYRSTGGGHATAVVQDVATQLVNTVKQVGVIATVLTTMGAVLLVQNVSTKMVNTIKQVGVIATVLTTRGAVLLVQDVSTKMVNTVKQVGVIATAVVPVQDVATQLVNKLCTRTKY